MTEIFTVESSQVGADGQRASLILGPYDRHSFLAQVRRDGLHATASIATRVRRGYTSDGLADFFGELAANWRGWTGRRDWISFEGNLELHAEFHHTGHVGLQVALSNFEWQLKTAIALESGQLERLALDASMFEQSASSAT